MIAHEIILSEKASADLRMRSFFHNLPLPFGTPSEWDKKLKGYDCELSLRFNPESKNFIIFYDHHGQLSVIRSFAQDESFGMAFWNVKHNSSLSMRDIMRMRQGERDTEEKRQKDLIADCSQEFGTALHHASRGRMTNDSVIDNKF